MSTHEYGFATKTIHGPHQTPHAEGAVSAPIFQTSTFAFDHCQQGGRRFAGEEAGYIYSRLSNPTTTELEDRLAQLENAEASIFVASGMGAVSAAIWTICKAGDHIIADKALYGCTFTYLSAGIARYGVEVSFVDTSHIEEVQEALRKNTVLVYLETPANPHLKVVDLEAVATAVHSYKESIKVICDNTFATPYNQRPLDLGCDVVLHSATKYLNGHGDVIAGCVASTAEFISQVRMVGVKDMTGSVLGPFEAWLTLRGLKTMELRMQRHNQSAAIIAQWLEDNSHVARCYYPGLASHPGHEIAIKQMPRGFGGVISFELKGGKEAGMLFVNHLKLATIAVSLGNTETMVEHPASMTHSVYPPEELQKAGISDGLIRLAIGLENVEDILLDLEQAFAFL